MRIVAPIPKQTKIYHLKKKKFGGGFLSYRVTEFPNFRVSKFQSFKVGGREEGGPMGGLGTDHVISGSIRGLEKKTASDCKQTDMKNPLEETSQLLEVGG